MGIQNYLINKKIVAAINEATSKKNNEAYVNIANVAIFVDEMTNFKEEAFRKLQEIMNLDETHFHILTYKEKKTNYNEFRGVVLFQNEINWKGNIISKEVQEFLKTHYDLLIDYTQANTIKKQLVVASINADFKVGYLDKKDSLYQFMIAVNPKEIELFNKELVRYLKILKFIA